MLLKNTLIKIPSLLQKYLLPYTCVLCSNVSTLNTDLCDSCWLSLPKLENNCTICAKPIFTVNIELSCGNCLKRKPYFDHTVALFPYVHPLDKFILALKFQHKLMYARLLGELLAEHLLQYYQNKSFPEIILPVPLHVLRLKERGFNQAIEIAKPIARKLNLEIDRKSIRRIRHSPAQSLIAAKERRGNVKSAFVVMRSFSFSHVAILDDVMTTGSTVNEVSKVLKKAGVEKVDVWCVARTL